MLLGGILSSFSVMLIFIIHIFSRTSIGRPTSFRMTLSIVSISLIITTVSITNFITVSRTSTRGISLIITISLIPYFITLIPSWARFILSFVYRITRTFIMTMFHTIIRGKFFMLVFIAVIFLIIVNVSFIFIPLVIRFSIDKSTFQFTRTRLVHRFGRLESFIYFVSFIIHLNSTFPTTFPSELRHGLTEVDVNSAVIYQYVIHLEISTFAEFFVIKFYKSIL